MLKSIQRDIIVIGSGLAGLMAAETLRRQGKKFILLTNGMGTVAHFSGTVDLLGYWEGNITDPWSALKNLRETHKEHPYAWVSDEEISLALEIYTEILGEYGIKYVDQGDNVLLPTAMGTLKPSYLVPETMLPVGKEFTIVAFDQYRDWQGMLISEGLKKHYEKVHLVSLRLPLKSMTLDAVSLAGFFEQDNWRREVVKELKKQELKGSLFMPAVLGIKNHQKIVSELEEELGHRIMEIPTLPPSAPGRRIYEAFMQKLSRDPLVEIAFNNKVVGIDSSKEGLELMVFRLDQQWRYSAKSIIWAGGGILGGGIVPGKDGSLEDTLLGVKGQAEISREHVYVAGNQLGYYDWPLEKSGAGVALATGYKAAMLAGGVSDGKTPNS